MDGGGRHGNWESVSAYSTSSVVAQCGAEHEYLSFMNTDSRMTKMTVDLCHHLGWKCRKVTEDGDGGWKGKERWREERGGLGGDRQISILSGAESV